MKHATCEACRSFRPEALTPVGDGAAELCWLCAHHVADHGASLADAATAECECSPDFVYPVGVRAALDRKIAATAPFVFRGTVVRRD